MDFKKLNNIVGWAVFGLALIIYGLTMDRGVSFWDTGEFIAAANKLQVVHPPGAPLYLLIGRFFTMFVPPNMVDFMMNFMSVLSTAFAAMFVYWSVVILAKRMLQDDGEKLSGGKLYAILGSGLVAGLAFVVSDSQWFNAAEAEVYALSTFLTALVIWMALKWTERANEKGADRLLIGIAYIIGLSIGVHLLNLLAIPVIALLIYITKSKEFSWKKMALAFLVGCGVLLFIQIGIIKWLPKIGSKFELWFVNDFGLPFGSGIIFFLLLIVGAVVGLLYYSSKIGNYNLNTSTLAVAFILLGYMSYGLVLIRSAANTPIDINNPDNVFNLMSYLNREQYGDKPLLYGAMYDAEPIDGKKVGDIYVKTEDGYEDIDDKIKYLFDPEDEMLFPRAWLFYEDSKVDFYKNWMDIGNKKPTMGNNLNFFYTYQLDHMYWRYFMWNFGGRQNDYQGQGGPENGNWISGFPMVDNRRISSSEIQPEVFTKNAAKNKFFLLPFALGILGMVFHFKYKFKDASVLTILFLLTGVAIVVYLNQDPLQPRERDYAYVGSFMTFAMWIGLAVAGLYRASQRETWKDITSNTIWYLGGILALIVLGFQAGHLGSVISILIICAIIFALYYALSMLLKKQKTNVQSIALTLAVLLAPLIMGVQGWDEHNRSQNDLAFANGSNYLRSCAENSILITEGDNDTYPLWYLQEVEKVRPDIRIVNNSLLKGDWYIDQVKQHNGMQPGLELSFDSEAYSGTNRQIAYLQEIADTVTMDQFIGFIASDDKRTKLAARDGDYVDTYPSRTVAIPIDKSKQVSNGLITEEELPYVEDFMIFEIPGNSIVRDQIMMLDIINRNINDRPIYFTGANLPRGMGLSVFIRQEGSAYRVIPMKDPTVNLPGYDPYDPIIEDEVTYRLLKDSLQFGNISSGAHLTQTGKRQVYRMADYMTRSMELLAVRGEKEKAMDVYSMIQEHVQGSSLASDDTYMLIKSADMISALFNVGENEKAKELARETTEGAIRQLEFVSNTYNVESGSTIDHNMKVVISNIIRYALRAEEDAFAQEIQGQFDIYDDE